MLEGVASYHFESREQCYISYANSPESWRLDDGSRPPGRKPFEQISYDESTRTFKGRVSWPEPFDGAVRWDYTIVFSEARTWLSCLLFSFSNEQNGGERHVGQDFGHIEAGRVQPYGSLGFPQPAQHFGDPATPDSSRLYYARKPSALAASDELKKRFLDTQPSEPAEPAAPRHCAVQ